MNGLFPSLQPGELRPSQQAANRRGTCCSRWGRPPPSPEPGASPSPRPPRLPPGAPHPLRPPPSFKRERGRLKPQIKFLMKPHQSRARVHCSIDEITVSSRREFAPESFLGCYAIWNEINYLQQRDPCLCRAAGAQGVYNGCFSLLSSINGSHGKEAVTSQTQILECERRSRDRVGKGEGGVGGHLDLPARHCNKMQQMSWS